MMINNTQGRIKLTIPGIYSTLAMKILAVFINKKCSRYSSRKWINAIQDVNFDENGVLTLYCTDGIRWRQGYSGNDARKENELRVKMGYAFKEMIKEIFDNYTILVKTEAGLKSTVSLDVFNLDKIHDMSLSRFCKAHGSYGNASAIFAIYCEVSDFYRNWNYDAERYMRNDEEAKKEFRETLTLTLKQLRCFYELIMGRNRKKLKAQYGDAFDEIVGEELDPFQQMQLKAYNDALLNENQKYKEVYTEIDTWYAKEKQAFMKALDEQVKAKRDALRKQYDEACKNLKTQFCLLNDTVNEAV